MHPTRKEVHLSIAEEFTRTPGPRTRVEGVEGAFSAEDFIDSILERKFDEAVASGAVLVVDLDGGFGYGTSFLEEAFGGLARRKNDIELVLNHIDFKSDEEPYLRTDVITYIKEARTGSAKKR